MKKTILIYKIILIIMIIFNIILVRKSIRLNNSYSLINEEYVSLKNSNESVINEFESSSLKNIELENTYFPDIKVINKKKVCRISKIIEDNKLNVIFRFKEGQCDPCIAYNISMLRDVLYKYQNINIIILSNYKSMRQFIAFENQNNVNVKVYNVENISDKIDNIDKPFYFIIEKDMIIRDMFVTIKNKEIQSNRYIKQILSKYKNELL